MNERFAIYCIGKGYFNGFDYSSTSPFEPIFSEEYFELFLSEFLALQKIEILISDGIIMRGVYRIDKLIFVK